MGLKMMRWMGLKESSCSTHLTCYCSVLGAEELRGVEQCQGSECHAPQVRADPILWDVWFRGGSSCSCPSIPKPAEERSGFSNGFSSHFLSLFSNFCCWGIKDNGLWLWHFATLGHTQERLPAVFLHQQIQWGVYQRHVCILNTWG